MTHIEFDFESPVWRHLYQELSRDHSFFRYDARGNGLSDREVPDVTFEKFVDDLEAVVDAAGIDRFALLGISQGCAVSVAYAVRHPERVSHLVLLGGFAVGWKKRARTEAEKEAGEAMLTLVRLGLGSGKSGIQTNVHITVYSGREQGTGRLVQRISANLKLARRRRAQSFGERRSRREFAAIAGQGANSRHACPSRCQSTLRIG
jgi:pimeloyl-ACP methyl ester carboxylesterase